MLQMNLFTKYKQTHRPRERTYGCRQEECGEGIVRHLGVIGPGFTLEGMMLSRSPGLPRPGCAPGAFPASVAISVTLKDCSDVCLSSKTSVSQYNLACKYELA